MRIQKLNTGDRLLNMIQDNVSNVVDPIAGNPLVNGIILSKVALVSGANQIPHKLQRRLLGWFIVRQRSAATIYDTQDSNLTPSIYLNLTASANVTVDLYVF